MKTRATRTLITGVALLAQLGLLMTLPARAKMTATVLVRSSSSEVTQAKSDETARMRISKAYGKLPLSFEQNQGQADRKVKFLSRGPNYALLLTPTEAVLSLRSEKPADSGKAQTPKPETQSAMLRMKLVGANRSPKLSGLDQLTGKSNYLIGGQTKWHTNITNYAKVQYDGVYPGIDLVYYGNQRRLEYDFVVAPGADAGVIRLKFSGADEMSLEADGSLRLKLKGGEVTQPAPVIYQKTEGGERQQVAGHYVLKGDEVTFEIANYDHGRELVIDPQLLYATFYGGSGRDIAEDIAVDGSGNAYITGSTNSSDLLLKSASDGALGGPEDAFVLKLNPAGNDFHYATYLGGTSVDTANAIAVTSDGKACVTGMTLNDGNDSDFPTTPSRFQGNGFGLLNRAQDAFVTVLAPAGNSLAYSTFFAGNALDSGNAIAVDAANNVYIAGETFSENLPTKNAFQSDRAGTGSGRDAFVARFNPALSGNNSLIYASFLGGDNGNRVGDFADDIAVTPAGVAFLVGTTDASDFPTESPSQLPPFQTIHRGLDDAFIAKVSPSGALIYSTLFGGNDEDQALGVAVDSEERAYVTGFTLSNAASFPLKNAFQPNRIGSAQDAFVAKFNADGTALFYSSFLGGGTTNNSGRGIGVDAGGNAYVTGLSSGFNPALTVNGFPPSVPNSGGLVAKIEPSDATGTSTPKILYMDGFGTLGNAIALDPRGNVYIVGDNNGSFPTTPGAFQETYNGGPSDATVAKIASTFPDTIGTFRPPFGPRSDEFRLRNSNTAGPPDLIVDFGQAGDQAVAGDWNGDGVDDVGVFRSSTGQFLLRQPIRLQIGGVIIITITLNFGLTGDRAVVGDWNGDGIDTPGVFRNGQFLLTNGPNTANSTPPIDLIFSFGAAADLPVAGDWNGDGVDSIGTFLAGKWALRNSNSAGAADINVLFGSAPGNLPVVGDWNGDGIDTIGVYLPSNVLGAASFGLNNVNANPLGNFEIVFAFGADGDLPIAGDWNGRPDPFTPPNSGINDPSTGSSSPNQLRTFTTNCSDPDGWRNIATIDFKIDKSAGNGNGVPIALWVQFNENTGLISFYDPDSGSWQQGYPGTNVVLSSRFAELHLANAAVVGSGPTGASVQIRWPIVFKNDSIMNNYKQYLMITDDAGLSTGFDKVGSWTVTR